MPYTRAMLTAITVICLALVQPEGAKQAASPKTEVAKGTAPAGAESPFNIEAVVEHVEVPWSILWTGKDRMLFDERPGRVRVVEGGTLREKPLYTVPDIVKSRGGEIGLMGMCIHPKYAENKFVYIAYGSTEKDIRVVRLKDTGEELSEPKVILDKIPAAPNHAGCRLAFGPDGKLYITCGENFKRQLAQDMSSLGGKTLRLNDDGTIPEDNPFLKKEGARPEIYSYGQRNPQGIDWQPGSGLMWQCEHGPSGEKGGGQDEINIVEMGHNLGWPEISGAETKEGMDSPITFWKDAIAPASVVFYNANVFPQFKGNLLVAGLGGLRSDPQPGIYRLEIDGRKVTKQERIPGTTALGRIRCVAVGPDGAIYFSTSNKDGRGRAGEADDRIMRITPKK